VPQRVFIRDLGPAQFVEGLFAVQNCQLGQTKSGKPYIKCLLADKTGRTPGRMWNATDELFRQLPTDGFVWIAGQTQPYQGEMQIIIQQIQAQDPTAMELRDLLPCTEYNVDEMFREVLRYLQTLEHPALKALADRYLEDGKLMEQFCQAPAAMTLHHAYIGGLLEHTLSLMRLAEVILPLYPKLNRDIVLLGLFVHDLGKCVELTWEQGFGYSADGQLVGHVARGILWLEEKARACEQLDPPVKIPAAILRVMHHIILSHHGQAEFGALKVPATPEAIVINLIDNLDAKMNMALSAARNGESDLGGDFTEKVWALNTRLYRPDPTLLEDGQ
jgi:3'-5' exoribonuclease